MADPLIIETAELRKHYDSVEAVRGVSLQVPPGSIYGFLGRNGAGKATTIKILLGMARAATGLAELLVLAVIPSLLLPLLSPAIGQSYSLADTLVHSACRYLAGTVFYSLTFLLSTVFSDVWRPALIALCAAALMAFFDIFRDLSRFSVFRMMSAEGYFRSGELPWLGLLISAVVSVALLYAAGRNIARQDF